MIGIEDALALYASVVQPLPTQSLDVRRSLGRVLATDVHSAVDLPRFDQSAVDGYAVLAAAMPTQTARSLAWIAVSGRSTPGSGTLGDVPMGEAARVLTGARMPSGTDSVILQEEVEIDGGAIGLVRPVVAAQNVRVRGEEVAAGELIAKKGQRITAGLMASIINAGMSTVSVIKKPRISVITTGDELKPVGVELGEGEIPDSNGPMVQAALESWGYAGVEIQHAEDTAEAVEARMREALERCDVLITTGGASVGDRDYIVRTADKIGLRRVLWKVAQKPGKPMYVGTHGHSIHVGLPGNPGAVLCCLSVHVRRILHLMEGSGDSGPAWRYGKLSASIKPDSRRARLVRMKVFYRRDATVELVPLARQDSHMLSNCNTATGLVLLPPSDRLMEQGDIARWIDL